MVCVHELERTCIHDRYGMVLLYLGTLFMVIGYHNNWVSFMKFLGLAMVILGILCVGSAVGRSFSLYVGKHDERAYPECKN